MADQVTIVKNFAEFLGLVESRVNSTEHYNYYTRSFVRLNRGTSLETLVGCTNCLDCTDCVNCTGCCSCQRCSNCNSCCRCFDCNNITDGSHLKGNVNESK